MDATRDDHPDEGTIHAWLDGAFDAPTAEAIDAHVRSCPSCAARVAEARGLIAGASRVVSALDDVPSGVTPAWGRAPAANSPAARGTWRLVTPTRAAIAATIVVALGITLTRQRMAPEMDVVRSSAPVTSAAVPQPVLPHDVLLDSAVKRNVDSSNPPRSMQAAAEPAIPVPAVAPLPPTHLADSSARSRVAVASGALRAQADSAGVVPDRAAVVAPFAGAGASGVGGVERREMAASRKADAAVQPAPARNDVAVRPTTAECFRVETTDGAQAQWGSAPLPLVLKVDSAVRSAQVSGADGTSDARAIWTKKGDDSVTFQLRRIGYTGSLILTGTGDVRAGVMRSSPLSTQLQEVVTTGTGAAGAEELGKRSVKRKKTSPAPADTRAAAPLASENGMPATAVVARRVGCP